jgi:hypothetical protein
MEKERETSRLDISTVVTTCATLRSFVAIYPIIKKECFSPLNHLKTAGQLKRFLRRPQATFRQDDKLGIDEYAGKGRDTGSSGRPEGGPIMKSMERFHKVNALLCRLMLPQLYLLACLAAAAQSPEQEMEAEAYRLLPTFFTKCGDDYFSKQTFRGNPNTYIIGQYKELTPRVISHPLSKADPLNGIEWKGTIQFTASVMREFAHGKTFSGLLSTHKPDVWGEWKELGIMAAYAFPIEKKNGRITADQRGPMERASIDCAAIPR